MRDDPNVDLASAGVSLDELRADGFFDDVTAAHRRDAAIYHAKHAPPQPDLFA